MTGKRRLGRDPEPQRRPPAGPAVPPAVIAPRTSRRDLRAQRKRAKRRRLGAAGIAALAVVGVAAAVGVTLGVRHVTADDKKPVLGQTTVLFSVVGSDGAAVETALLAHDSRTHQGAELLIPGRLLTEVCGYGNQQLRDVLALPDGQRLSRAALRDALGGVVVDASWVLTTAQLATLVDEVGGITADVDVDVVGRAKDGSRVVLVQHGPGQHLTGPTAAAFATYFTNDADAAGNLVRLQAVIDGILASIPQDAEQIQHKLAALGKGAASSVGAEKLADFLAGLATDARANNVLPTELPVVKIDAGNGPPAYRVDTDQAMQFVTTNLAASLPASAGSDRPRVLVQNGVGTPGLVATACTKLVEAGFAFAGSGNANNFDYVTSKVLVFDRSVDTARTGNAVARALGLPERDVAVSDAGQNIADVLVILGRDYKR